MRSLFGGARARQALLVVACIGFFLLLRAREQSAARVRSTRAEITTATLALAAWRADHDRACPSALSDLVAVVTFMRCPATRGGALCGSRARVDVIRPVST